MPLCVSTPEKNVAAGECSPPPPHIVIGRGLSALNRQQGTHQRTTLMGPDDQAFVLAAFLAAARVVPFLAAAFSEAGTISISSTEPPARSEEHTSELQSLMRLSYAVFCLKKQ